MRTIVADNLRAYRMSVLYGPSGVGKSSLLRAGVVRDVHDEARRRIAAGDRPEHAAVAYGAWAQDPVAGLKSAIRAALEQLSPALGADLPDGSVADLVGAASERLDGTLLIILDQFEEYFLYHAADGPFVDELVSTFARRDAAASVLVSIREDALARLDALTGRLPSLLDNLVRVEHLDRGAARAAIEQPLELWNRELAQPGEEVRIEPALVEAVLDGVQTGSLDEAAFDGGGGAAGGHASIQTPYLQLVLVRLWEEEQRTGSRVLRLQTLQRLHGAEQIVALHVDTAIARLSPSERAVAAKVLRQLVTASGTKIALRSADLAEYAELDEPTVIAVLERLTSEARILQAIGDSRYEIYHDALARPILEWRRRWQADQDRARDRRRNRIAVAIAGGLLLTVVVVAALAVLAITGRDDARRQAADATSVALASASGDERDSQPDVALLLALGALGAKDRPEARRSMLAAREAAGYGAALGIMRGHTEAVNAVAFAQRGRVVVSGGNDGRILLWDAATHRQLGPAITVRSAVERLAVSPDGRRLAAGTDDGTLRLWDIASHRLLGVVRRRGTAIDSLAFSPDGATLASGASGSAPAIWIWDARSLAARDSIELPRLSATDLAFSPDGRTLAYATVAVFGVDGAPPRSTSTVGLLNVRSARTVGRRLIRSVELRSLAFTPNGRALAIGGAATLLWDLDSGRTRRVAGASGAVAVSADGRRLATAGADGRVRVFDVATGRRLSEPLTGPTQPLRAIAFSPDGRTLAAAGDDLRVWLFDAGFPRVLGRKADVDCARHLDVTAVATTFVGASRCSRFDAVALDPTGRTLASAGSDGAIRLWNARSFREAAPPLVPDGRHPAISSLAFSADGRMLAAASEPVRLWDWRSRRLAATLPDTHGDVASVAVSPDGRLLAAAGDNGRTVLWDVRARRVLSAAPPRLQQAIASVAFSPDGRLLALGGSDGNAHLWNVATHRALSASPGNGFGTQVAFSPDGRTLAAADGDTLSLLSVPTLRLRGKISSRQNEVSGLAFTPDGHVLIAGSDNGIELFDPEAARPIGTLLHGDDIRAEQIAAAPDGAAFASAHGPDLRVWRHILWHTTGELEREVCALVGTGLSRAEWTRYAPGVPHRALCGR